MDWKIYEGDGTKKVEVEQAKMVFRGIAFAKIRAIAKSAGDTTEYQNAVLIHDLRDKYHDGDCIAFGWDLPEDSDDATAILKDVSSHSTAEEDMATIIYPA